MAAGAGDAGERLLGGAGVSPMYAAARAAANATCGLGWLSSGETNGSACLPIPSQQ